MKFWQKLGVAAAAGAGISGLSMYKRVRQSRRRVNELHQKIWPAFDDSSEPFDPEMIEDLPHLARQYLSWSIASGTPLYQAAQFEVEGRFRLPPFGWLPMKADNMIVPSSGYIWEAEVGSGLLRMNVADTYAHELFEQDVRLYDTLPIVHITDAGNAAQSALGRLAIEAVLLPTALVPQKMPDEPITGGGGTAVEEAEDPTYTADEAFAWRPQWTTRDRHHLQVANAVDGHPYPVELTLRDNGSLSRAETRRWGNPDKKGFAWYGFFVNVFKDVMHEGVRFPSDIEAGWISKDGVDESFYRAKLRVRELR